MCTSHAPERKVRFSTVTMYVFTLGYGGSSLPKDMGPPIGLDKHNHTITVDLESLNASIAGHVRKFNHVERMALLRTASYETKEIAEFCFEAIDIRKSRLETLEELEESKYVNTKNLKRQQDASRSFADTTSSKQKRKRLYCVHDPYATT
jgi:hypothetical protein